MLEDGVFCFCLFILACSQSRLWRRTFYPGIPTAVRARRHAASSPLPSTQACPDGRGDKQLFVAR